MLKQFSDACDQNRQPILEVLQKVFVTPGLVVEVGSGTGQHAAWLPKQLPHLDWQPTDRAENLPSIRAWTQEAALENVREPQELDVTQTEWPVSSADYVFSANTTHIMSWDAVEAFFHGVGNILQPGGDFCLYGPFNYNGNYSSVSNLRFDSWLRQRDPESGIRDLSSLKDLAQTCGLELVHDYVMPVNNQILHWRKIL